MDPGQLQAGADLLLKETNSIRLERGSPFPLIPTPNTSLARHPIKGLIVTASGRSTHPWQVHQSPSWLVFARVTEKGDLSYL